MDAAASKTLLQRELAMKITKTQLKQIIKEERQALIKENIISDMVDAIKDSGEDPWDWIKDHAEDLKTAAASAGETVGNFADDVVQGALGGVDTATGAIADVTTGQYGTALSRKGKSAKRKRAKTTAASIARSAELSAEMAADRAASAAQGAAQDQRRADRQAARERFARSPEGKAEHAAQLARSKKDRSARLRKDNPYQSSEETESQRRARALAAGGKGHFGPSWGESLNRDTLKRMIAEELQKVLKDR
jgi:hypothetical protein